MGKKKNKKVTIITGVTETLNQAMDARAEDAEIVSAPDQKEEIALDLPICPYATSIVTVYVGPQFEAKDFSIHSGILSPHIVLRRAIELDTISFPDTDPTIFEHVLSFLYTGDYTLPRPDGGLTGSLGLEMHSLLYCFSRRFELDGLVSLTMKRIEDLRGIPYKNVLDTARKIYRKLPKDDVRYREYFKNETRTAMRENMDIVQESWILDVFKEDNGRITVDLFTTLIGEARQETIERDVVSNTTLTPIISALDHPCEDRKKHLISLKGNGPWENCPRCRCERDQMMTTGRAIVSVAFTDICTFNQDINGSPDGISLPSKRKKGQKKLRRALREAICHLPIDRVTRGVLAEDEYEQCPDQAKHLKKVDGKWLWETCSKCQRDRQLICDKLREAGIGEGFTTLFGLGSACKASVAKIATASPASLNNQNSTEPAFAGCSVAAQTSERDHIVDECSQLDDPLSPETKLEDVSIDGPEEDWPKVTIDELSHGFPPKKKSKNRRKEWIIEAPPEMPDGPEENFPEFTPDVTIDELSPSQVSPKKMKSKNRREERIVEAPPEEAPYDFIPADIPEATSYRFPGEASLDTPPDTPESCYQGFSTKQAPSAPEPEPEPERNPWDFWGVPLRKPSKMDKGKEACPSSIASPNLENANPSDFRA